MQPGAIPPEESWTWQIKNRIDSLESLSLWVDLTRAEREAFSTASRLFRFAITPYYASLIDPHDENCPIRRQVVPRPEENVIRIGERVDPLGEEEREAAPNLVHRYADRALLFVTDRCPVYCRFCTRRRIVGRLERQVPRAVLAQAFAYILAHEEIRDVVVSGGDALMLADRHLDFILRSLRRIPHVEWIRVATRMPVTCPMRITDALVNVLTKHQPVFVMTHFNHPKELTESSIQALVRLADRGVHVYNQTVLLSGINDDAGVLAALNRGLLRCRATPYYLHQCDLAEGTEHFRTPLSTGIQIVEALRGRVSGLAIPAFVVDVPGGLGKVTMQPNWLVESNGSRHTFRTFSGAVGAYDEPASMCSSRDTHDAAFVVDTNRGRS